MRNYSMCIGKVFFIIFVFYDQSLEKLRSDADSPVNIFTVETIGTTTADFDIFVGKSLVVLGGIHVGRYARLTVAIRKRSRHERLCFYVQGSEFNALIKC